MKVDVDIDACKQGEREALGNLYKAYLHLHQIAERQLKIGGMDDHHCKESFSKVPAKHREG